MLCTSFVFAHAFQVQIVPSTYSKSQKILSKSNHDNSKENFKSSGFSHESFIFEAEEAEEIENSEDNGTQKARSLSHQLLFYCKKSALNLADNSKYHNKIFLSDNHSHSQLKNVKLLL